MYHVGSTQQGQGLPMSMQQQNPAMMPIGHHGIPQQHAVQQHQQPSPAMSQMIAQQQPLSNNSILNNPPSMMTPNTPQQQLYRESLTQCSPYAMSVQSINSAQNSNAPVSQEASNLPTTQQEQQDQSFQPELKVELNTAGFSSCDESVSETLAAGTSTAPVGYVGDCPAPYPLLINETDPWTATHRMIMSDLRRHIMDYTVAAKTLAKQKFDFNSSDSSGELKGGTPSSYLMNPLSANPPSESGGPLSTNPMSVNPPGSAQNDTDLSGSGLNDSLSSAFSSGEKIVDDLEPEDRYVNCRNRMFNSFDAAEKYMATVLETAQQIYRLDSTFMASTPVEFASKDVAQLQESYVDEKRTNIKGIQKGIEFARELLRQRTGTSTPTNVATPTYEIA